MKRKEDCPDFSKRFRKPKITYKVKVIAKDSKRTLIHNDVPYEHLELMKINPNLSVYVLEVKNRNFIRGRE